MDRQLHGLLLSNEERAALEAAISDICAFNSQPAPTDRPASPHLLGVPQSLLLLCCLSGLALLTPVAQMLLP